MDCKSYKPRKTHSTLITLLASFAVTQGLAAASSEDLEPCINGGVSETRLYVSQAQEDQVMQRGLVDNSHVNKELELEPCISGGVSATGKYASQATEDEMTQQQFIQVGGLAH